MMSSDEFAHHWISREDGLLEMGTFAALIAGAGLFLVRAWSLRNERPKRFVSMLIIAAVVLVFGAGEEISWGQRIFGIETPEYFRAHNAQSETNFHNLVIADVGINKLIFGKLLAVGLICYLIVLPLINYRSKRIAKLINRFAVPVPRFHHTLAILAIVVIVETSPVRKRGEINEYALSSIAFLILLNPANRSIFLLGGRSRAESIASLANPIAHSIADPQNPAADIRRAA